MRFSTWSIHLQLILFQRFSFSFTTPVSACDFLFAHVLSQAEKQMMLARKFDELCPALLDVADFIDPIPCNVHLICLEI